MLAQAGMIGGTAAARRNVSQSRRAVSEFSGVAFRDYRRAVHRYLTRRLRNPQDAEDLAQEVYLRMLRIDESRLVHKPLAYLYGIAAHVLADYRTEQEHDRKHLISDANDPDTTPSEPARHLTDNLAERLNLQQQIERALSRLPSTHAAVLIAHKRDGFSYSEVAERLRLSIHTVEKYVTQAKAVLRRVEWER